MKRFRIQLVIALVVLICGISLMGVIYLVFNKPEVYINPGVIVTQPSPVSAPIQPIRSSSGMMRSDYPYSYSMYPLPYTAAPQATMQPSHGLLLTSSAQVQNVGGGMSYGMATTSNTQNQRGISYTMTTVTSFATFAANRQVAAPEAMNAPEMAKLVTEPRRAPGPPDIGELDPEHQLPVGSPLVLVVMAGLYAAAVRKRKEDAE